MNRLNGGFTLLEVLVSVLVLAIGLLGMAALQMTGLSNNYSAYLRSQATQIAYDLADRMRANPAGVFAANYNNPSMPSSAPTCTDCTPADMASRDFYEWRQAITTILPGGTGVVCVDATPTTAACDGTGNIYAIKVTWTDRENGAAVTKTFVTSFWP
ncbi:type IV pilus modification protein PilV [Methyloterricola oryzae]|uniref:type IV pilus modification protein PilV n=1 Tax=Methyloterricola oryzae TaxID=1495050 RepID=UPI0005EB011F|nr:type IV pilus modification protein PilV [Methyloterricola oryzae]